MINPVISFIIPVYNCEKYLEQCFKSILFQNSQYFEIIAINDGSTDRSLDIIVDFAGKYESVNYISTENAGAAAARNKGIDIAKGKYIAFLDSDDVLCKNALNSELIDIIDHQEPDLISMELFYGNSDLSKGELRGLKSEGVFSYGSKEYSDSMRNHFASYLYKSSLIKENHIRYPEGVRVGEDRVFLYHASAVAKNIYLFGNPWFIYRMHGESIMHTNKAFDYLVDGNIRAWWWLKDKVDTQFRLSCESQVFSCMAEYIELSTKRGTPLKEIIDKVNQCSEFGQVLKDYDQFWKSSHNAEVYHKFNSSPETFYRSKLLERTVNRILNPIRSNRFVKEMYLRRTYRYSLKEYIDYIQ